MNEILRSENMNPKGLSEIQAAERLKVDGPNELSRPDKKNAFSIVFKIITEPMILLLIACGTIYFFLGDVKESTILIGCIAVIIVITFYQENKTEKALEALKNLSSPRALVIRDGVKKRIAGREVVVGDIIILNEGDRVPADAILLSSANLEANESLLTGESLPVIKINGQTDSLLPKPGGDDSPAVFSGTLIVKGHGVAIVKTIGANTEMGKIGKFLNEIKQPATRLQSEIKKIVLTIAIFGGFLCVLVSVIYSLTRHDWLNGFLSGLALAMGILPEEFPLILTIFLALGAWRIAKSNVLTRNLPAIENLGSANVLCVDKTGTITHNQMSVKSIYAYDTHLLAQGIDKLPENFHELTEFAALTVRHEALEPMEIAIKEFSDKNLLEEAHIHKDWQLLNEYPLSKDLLAISYVWKSPTKNDYIIAAKGAPEAIIELCHLSAEEEKYILSQVDQLAQEGMRVLGVARANFSETSLPKQQHDFNFQFLGLIGLADTIRPTVKKAVADCYSAGIRVIMITGDYAGTAKHIAKEIGLANSDEVITGPKLDTMEDTELNEKIKTVNIFARVVPEQKLRIIKALKANNQIAAMTGDGVNDAPALKASDIGIAMGDKGTDVARESADLVLLDDNFSSIVQAVKIGRTVFHNLKKAMAYIVAIHVPIAGMSLIPVIFNWPLVMLPIHIVFMELVVDPACSLVFEMAPAEKTVMNQPPRKLSVPLFSKQTILFSLRQGLIVLAGVFGSFMFARYQGYSEETVRAITFSTLVFVNMGLLFINYSWSKTLFNTIRFYNKTFWLIQLMTLTFLLAALYIPYLQHLFKFSLLGPSSLAISFVFALTAVVILDVLKIMRLKR